MHRPSILIVTAAILMTAWPTCATPSQEPAVWEREAALLASAGIDQQAAARELLQLAISGADAALTDRLEFTRSRPDWPAPAREAVVYRFTQALRTLPPGSVPWTLLDELRHWETGVLVPDPDHPRGLVPLWNIRAAAAGVDNEWTRQGAQLEGLALLRANPRSLADAFALEASVPVRAGYLQAVGEASAAQLEAIDEVASRRLPTDPNLTPLAARAAALTGRTSSILTVIDHGRGPAVHHLVRQVSERGDTRRLARVLAVALDSPNREAAALALAQIYPRLAGTPAAEAAVLARLGDPELGAPAALALSRSPSLDTRLTLQALADDADDPAARHARLSLDLQARQEREQSP